MGDFKMRDSKIYDSVFKKSYQKRKQRQKIFRKRTKTVLKKISLVFKQTKFILTPVRSKCNWYEDGEKSSKFSLNYGK